jgi:hypothetical protein
MTFAKDPKRPGKYKLVPKAGGGAKPGAAAKPKAKKKPVSFVQAEINRQINQDRAVTRFTDQEAAKIADVMAGQSNAAAQIAGQFQPATAFDNPTLDATNQARVSGDAALTNQVVQDQSGALAALIAKGGGAGSELFANLRAAGGRQHQEYARHLQGLRPSLEARRAAELQDMRLKDAQMQLAKEQFGLQVAGAAADDAFRQQAFDAEQSAAAAKAEGGPTIYGLPADDKRVGAIKAEVDGWRAQPKKNRSYANLLNRIKQGGATDPSHAALVAAMVMEPAQIKKVGAYRFLGILRNQGVNERVQRNLLKRMFGTTPEKVAKVSRPGVALGSAATALTGSVGDFLGSVGGSTSGQSAPQVPAPYGGQTFGIR